MTNDNKVNYTLFKAIISGTHTALGVYLPVKEDGNLSKGSKLPSGLASMFVELAGANLAWG